MKRKLLDILRCPKCKGELELEVKEEDDEIKEGTLFCSKCDITYEIKEGIPDMIPPG
ncbi:MAG: methytransferase partner Trm112 [Thermoplasmata archaeon]